jgi:pimeloyl-ACP methyl ester carboxylesterase
MRMLKWASIGAAVVLAALAHGRACADAASGEAAGAPVDTATPGLRDVGLALADCRLEHPLELSSAAARCGRLAVPEDPSAPQGARIELRVAVVAALNLRSRGAPLFLLAGGPGQSAVDLYASFAGAFARINRNHDIVMVDQRGTGASAPLRCDYPDDWTASRDASKELERATAACLAKYGERVRFYTTSIAVRDLDAVRRALGYGTIDLYGASYGTRVAELYLRHYPTHVHAMILDGVTDPEHPIGPDTPEDGERALGQIIARCAESLPCTRAYPKFAAELAELRARFGPEKLPIHLDDPATGAPHEVTFDRDLFNAALRLLSYSATEAALLPTLIHGAAEGRVAPVAAQALMMAGQIGAQLASGMQNTVVCSEDVPFFALSAADRARIAATYQGMDQLDALGTICKIWPRGPVDADLHAPLRSEAPTLLLSGEADPVTPPATAERVARGLTRHRHLVLAGEGHGQLATGCVPRLMAAFLDAALPERIDATCLDAHRAPPFFVSATGPAP